MKRDPDARTLLEIFERAKKVLGRFEDVRRRMVSFPIKEELYVRVLQRMSRSRIRSIRKMITRMEKKADFCEEVVSELEKSFQEILQADPGSKEKSK